MAIVDDIAGLRRILTQSRVIAVVGLSAHWYRPSYFAAKYMQEHGYRVIPVNPTHASILGERCYPAVDAIPDPVDIVDCFRAPSEIEPIARAAVAKGAKVLWMQIGIRNDAAARIAIEAGLDVVMDRCVKIEHGRLMGGLNWAGVNTGVISARRAGQREPGDRNVGLSPSSGDDGPVPLQCSVPGARR
jgi:predicted CoA-binding protein